MIFDEKRFVYCLKHSSTPEPEPILLALERETHLRTLHPQMLSGPYQGMLLQMISHMIRPRRVLEIGTFTGYGAICLSQGMDGDGLLHTIEVNDEFTPIINKYIELAGLKDKIALHLGDASAIIPTLEDTFDLAFLDAGKMDYAKHYELVLPKLRPGGFLLADNVLWAGKVPAGEKDATATALNAFNNMVQTDDRVENLLLPLRDGLMVVRKKG
ncbi:MAG: O-methyltransferase [Thermoanaerobaculia bacterium]|nr:O-methyltransferase [Thermoanaerobaculia bacterium]